MEDRYYVVIILAGPEDNPEDEFNPKCYPKTYKEAVSIARPWVDQGHFVVITTRKDRDEDE